MSAKRTDNKGRILRTGESQRKDLTYMYRYTDKWGDRVTVYAPTLQELREKEKQVVVADVQGVRAVSNTTLNELAERVCQLAANRSAGTKAAYNVNRRFVERYPIGSKRVQEIKPSETKLWLIDLHKSGYSPDTVRTVAHFCKRACQIGVEDKMIVANPFNYSLNFLPPKNKRTALTPKEQEDFFNFIEKDYTSRNYVNHVIVLVETGLRIGEFLGLTKNDVDLDNKILSVTHQLQGDSPCSWQISKPKTKTSIRKIPLSDKACVALRAMINRADELQYDLTLDGHTGFFALGPQGRLVSSNQLNWAINGMCERYNKEKSAEIKVTAHILRHTFCTNMYRKGLSALSLQYVMGHADISMTFGTYTHSNSEQAITEFRNVSGL